MLWNLQRCQVWPSEGGHAEYAPRQARGNGGTCGVISGVTWGPLEMAL